MFSILKRAIGRQSSKLRHRIAAIYALLLVINLGAWIWALMTFRIQPILFGTALLAYGFGLRHAVDADHIAAIDNVTRKLMNEGKRPVMVGFFFALGHASVVILAAAAIAATAKAFNVQALRQYGGLISTSVSALFLFLIAAMNLLILRGVWTTFRHVRNGGSYVEEDFDLLLNKRGLVSRLFRPLFALISNSWHMFPLGFLFGLGFDTATEVALLGISATQAAKGLSIWTITDGILMLGAYDWAFVKPIRKLYYNLVITLLAVVIAVFIGGIETLGLIKGQLGLSGGIWNAVDVLSGNFNNLGFIIVGLFIVAWVGSMIVYRYNGYDELETTIVAQSSPKQRMLEGEE